MTEPETGPASPPSVVAQRPADSSSAARTASGLARAEATLAWGLNAITSTALGPYQTAIVRIGFAFTWLCFLLREFPHRHELYGPDSPWSWALGSRLIEDNGAFSVLMWSDRGAWFECVYAMAILASVGLLLGWRTRALSVLFMIGVLSLQNRSVFMGDGGDNVIHLMALYLVLTRCGQVWSLDARRERLRAERDRADADRVGIAVWLVLGGALLVPSLLGFGELPWWDRGPIPELGWFPGLGWGCVLWGMWLAHGLWWAARRYAPGEPRAVLDILANLAHNAALLVIIVEVCLIYSTAGWYKIQGSRWQDGTAAYYPMHLDYFAPWPDLSQVLGDSGLLIMLFTYGTVLTQVAFPFTLFNRKVKNVLLTAMILEHATIAVLLGLPFFSLAMIAADAVFLPTAFLVWLGARIGRPVARLRRGGGHGQDTSAAQRRAETTAVSGAEAEAADRTPVR